ncbi:helix-turn-helix domain-containing protein [Cohnella cellulosilytica]|uniref:Helix-turn-helix domain-containing protein n=1 Tax=Cohnella cellulosilytica TaxID=986710 RepID=A0ABW2FCK4_9BACL
MIADDEVIIRNGLAKVIKWQEIGLTLLEPAASAEEALERIDREKPDILLTDIRMSGMTGLELAEEARGKLPNLEVVILTGYDDFVYAQQAIRQNVSDYLLKTSKPEEIIRTVLKAKQKAEEKQRLRSREYQTDEHERNRRLVGWIVHGEQDAARTDWLPASPTGRWQVLIAEADGWGTSRREQALLQFAVNNAVRDLLSRASFVHDGRIAMVVPASSGEPDRQRRRGEFARLEKTLNCNLVVAGGLVKANPQQLRDSYATALEALRFKPLMNAALWEYADIADRKGGKTVCTQEEEKELSAILLEDDPIALKRWAGGYIEAHLRDTDTTPQTLQASLQSVALAAHRWLERIVSAVGRKDEREPPVVPPFRYEANLIENEGLFQHLFDTMQYGRQLLAEDKISHVVRAIVYIEEQVGRDLSLTQVAEHVHLHPNHLSELFKKETGVKFVDYVIRTRMQRAMELLASTPTRIAEIAMAVGYEDVKYFGQMFKKFTGSTPSQFRERMSSRRKTEPQERPELLE